MPSHTSQSSCARPYTWRLRPFSFSPSEIVPPANSQHTYILHSSFSVTEIIPSYADKTVLFFRGHDLFFVVIIVLSSRTAGSIDALQGYSIIVQAARAKKATTTILRRSIDRSTREQVSTIISTLVPLMTLMAQRAWSRLTSGDFLRSRLTNTTSARLKPRRAQLLASILGMSRCRQNSGKKT